MVALLFFLLRLLVSPFRPISRLEAENAALRRQLIVLQRQVRGRVQFTNSDRLFFLQLYRWFPSIVKAMTTIRPETLVRWHRAGFRRYWRWKSRNLGGRPPVDAGLRALSAAVARLAAHHERSGSAEANDYRLIDGHIFKSARRVQAEAESHGSMARAEAGGTARKDGHMCKEVEVEPRSTNAVASATFDDQKQN